MSGAPLRRSAFEAFACPFAYEAKYESGFEDTSPPAQRGIAFHEAAGRYIHKLAAANIDSDPLLAQGALEEALSMRPLAWDLIRDIEVNLWPRHVENFRLNLDAFLLAEERQTNGDVTWIPDLVYAFEDEDVLEIDDWKTFFVGMTEKEAAEAFQTRFYLWQAMHVWPGFKTYRMRYVFPRLGYDTTVELSTSELEAFGDRVHSLVDQIKAARERNYWPAIPGDHCKYCTLACPVADDPRRVPLRLTTNEEAEAALLRAVALHRQYEQIKESLRGYCEVNGAVSANGVAAQHKPVVSRRFDLVDVMDVLSMHGITDLSTLPKMEVAATTLQPLLKTKKRAAIAVDLLQVAKVRTTETFSLSKPVDHEKLPVDDADEVTV